MKKSGRTPVRDPPDLRYFVKTFPAKNSAARGIGTISRPATNKRLKLLNAAVTNRKLGIDHITDQ